jgi:hypothetical protein
MNFNYEGNFYIISSPTDSSLAAGVPYREYIKNKFDLVLVQHNCYLEPSFLIIDNLPDTIEIEPIR